MAEDINSDEIKRMDVPGTDDADASKNFYANQNIKATKNNKRTAQRANLPVMQGPNRKRIGMQRSKVDGTLQENIDSIEKELIACSDKTKKAELLGAIKVAKEVQKNILLSTLDAADL